MAKPLMALNSSLHAKADSNPTSIHSPKPTLPMRLKHWHNSPIKNPVGATRPLHQGMLFHWVISTKIRFKPDPPPLYRDIPPWSVPYTQAAFVTSARLISMHANSPHLKINIPI